MARSVVPAQHLNRISAERTSASLTGLGWTELPDWVSALTDLRALNLSSNRLTQLPDALGNLANLQVLNLYDNQLTQLPEWISDLTELRSLMLRRNQLTQLPDALGNLANLQQLDLSSNRLTRLPDALCNLTNLQQLDLSSNRLTRLPDALGNLANLGRLDLSGNQLNELPGSLADLISDGLPLSVAENPLRDPLPDLMRRGEKELVVYLRSLKDSKPRYEAKLLLVGEGNVGKSSLVAALKGDAFVEGRPTTHGIEISPIVVRHPLLDLDIMLRAWDFGGQEVYRVSHQFFFSKRAIYLVVWHSRQGQERDEVESWLRRIRLRIGDDATALVVATHSRERLADLDYPYLERLFQGILAGAFEIDSGTGDGIAVLRKAVSEQAAQLPQMGQRISPRWIAAREAVLTLGASEPQIRYQRFAEICREHGVDGDETDTLAKLMHDLGLVIYYDEDDGLKDVVVLNPEWLTKAISYVLEDRVTADASGVLDHKRLKAIWQDRDGGYPAQYHPYFLRLMEKFDITYRLDGDDSRSLIPQMVAHQRPSLPWQPGDAPPSGYRTLLLNCRLDEPAPGLIPWLTARHHHASTGLHWRRGVFLRHPISAYRSEALLELRRDNELALVVRAPSPDLYFNVLRDSIENLITHRWPGLGYRLYVPCRGIYRDVACPGQFPLDGLLRIREAGQTESVSCMDCGQLREISVLLTGFALPRQPVAENVRQAEEVKRALDRLTTVVGEVGGKVDGVHSRVGKVQSQVGVVHGQAAEIALAVRRVNKVVSSEVTDCPRLFTLAHVPQRRWGKAILTPKRYELTLWCEHPGHEHPWVNATYVLVQPPEWYVTIAPYARLVFRTLKLAVPVAAALDVLSLPDAMRSDAHDRLDVMKAIIDDLPTDSAPGDELGYLSRHDDGSGLRPAEGRALRAVRQLLLEKDRARGFGDMRRVQSPSGDLLWVCPKHYPDYDPGLPTLR